jgi:hypothetical protein
MNALQGKASGSPTFSSDFISSHGKAYMKGLERSSGLGCSSFSTSSSSGIRMGCTLSVGNSTMSSGNGSGCFGYSRNADNLRNLKNSLDSPGYVWTPTFFSICTPKRFHDSCDAGTSARALLCCPARDCADIQGCVSACHYKLPLQSRWLSGGHLCFEESGQTCPISRHRFTVAFCSLQEVSSFLFSDWIVPRCVFLTKRHSSKTACEVKEDKLETRRHTQVEKASPLAQANRKSTRAELRQHLTPRGS